MYPAAVFKDGRVPASLNYAASTSERQWSWFSRGLGCVQLH